MAGLLKSDLEAILSSGVFRANPQYELVLFDRLPASQQAALAELKDRANFYGILRPHEGSGLTIKSVTRDTALLYLTLRDAGTLPHYARPSNAEQTGAIVRMVLDQILQVQQADRFVSGPEAHALFYEPVQETTTETYLQHLSISALQYGQLLPVTDVLELSARLYGYHRIPVSSRWLESFPTTDRVKQRLGISTNGAYRGFLDSAWDSAGDGLEDKADADGGNGWLSWVLRRSPGARVPPERIYKLYISPMPEFIENVFALTLRTLTRTAALQFKIGANVGGLLRPDKMVAYFGTFDELQSAAQLLATRLDGCPVHGVPFTAQLAADGLLSWGVDPPASERLLNWQPEESWRLWLTNRLANALLAARSAGESEPALQPWQYALQRLELEGIDTRSWTAARRSWA
jgi:hypothetical protein